MKQPAQPQAVSFARPYVSTPDLAERFAQGAELNPEAPMTAYYTTSADTTAKA